jgi:hypothetical protein
MKSARNTVCKSGHNVLADERLVLEAVLVTADLLAQSSAILTPPGFDARPAVWSVSNSNLRCSKCSNISPLTTTRPLCVSVSSMKGPRIVAST